MKNYLLLLLTIGSFLSCKKDPMKCTPIVKEDTIVIIDTPKKPITDTSLTISNNSNTADQVVQVSNLSTTFNVSIAAIDLTVKGTPLTINSLPVTIVPTNLAVNVSNIITTLRLYDNSGNQIDSEVIPQGSNTVTFYGLRQILPVGTTTFTVKADIAAMNGSSFSAGTGIQLDVTASNVAAIKVVDKNTTQIAAANLHGLSNSGNIYFYVNGIFVSYFGPPTNTYSEPTGSETHGVFTMTIPFSVTAFGQPEYIPASAIAITDKTTTGPNIQCTVDNGSALVPVTSVLVATAGTANTYPDRNNNYYIPVGQTINFMLVVTYSPTVAASYRAKLVNVNFNATDSGTDYQSYTVGFSSNTFTTAYVSGQ